MLVEASSEPVERFAGVFGAVFLEKPSRRFLQEEDARDEDEAGYVLEGEGEAPCDAFTVSFWRLLKNMFGFICYSHENWVEIKEQP